MTSNVAGADGGPYCIGDKLLIWKPRTSGGFTNRYNSQIAAQSATSGWLSALPLFQCDTPREDNLDSYVGQPAG